ncbi:hypothetical protein WH47_11970 [Habropoda laboriosa]|uniref:Uncharacterized protein n=1 Tax=Habropoda laboriosa TaxID=597456 RepID=A0A0L7R829_9HYME|nr:hypothetical protein WH47_11970 [Habropoda laboriosa]
MVVTHRILTRIPTGSEALGISALPLIFFVFFFLAFKHSPTRTNIVHTWLQAYAANLLYSLTGTFLYVFHVWKRTYTSILITK